MLVKTGLEPRDSCVGGDRCANSGKNFRATGVRTRNFRIRRQM